MTMTAAKVPAPGRKRAIENIYPVTPMQEGLLFHTLADPQGGTYAPQIVLRFEGPMSGDVLREAWAEVLARHPATRSSFHWEERDEPFQVVHRDVEPDWREMDWRARGDAACETALLDLVAANGRAPFDLRRPPLLRLQWITCAKDRHVLVLRYHHIILDGWSASALVSEALRLYRYRLARTQTPPSPPPRPFADYVGWLKRQDHAAARTFWQRYLADLGTTTRVAGPGSQGPDAPTPGDFVRTEWGSKPSLPPALQELCRRTGVTLNTVLQGALAVVLAGRAGTSEAVFGTTTSGRPATLPGADRMIGLFINTLPVRVRLAPSASLAHWLAGLQQQQGETGAHEFLALREIQRDAPRDIGALFDCLMILESYPVAGGEAHDGSFRLVSIDFEEWTHYPLTLFIAPGKGKLAVSARHARNLLGTEAVAALLDDLARVLKAIAASAQTGGDVPLASVLGEVAPAPQMPASHKDKTPPRAPEVETVSHSPASSDPSPGEGAVSETQAILAAAWSEVLKGPPPGPDAHFFDLGGHSLLAARVITRLRRRLGLELPVRVLFERPVFSDLAAYIDALRGGAGPAKGHVEIEI